MSRHRRFISFSNEELKTMQDFISDKKLQKEIKEEFKTREYINKQHEEWLKEQPKVYAC